MPGLVVVTQTCDVVRSCAGRPFVEVCPLVEVDEADLKTIMRGQRPAFAHVPTLVGQRLVADIDRTMTLEKPVVAKWVRLPGWTTDEEARAFARALSRKRARFAFPDNFVALARKLVGRLSDKHGKDSDEGRALRALREIRVQASPDWDGKSVEVFFWFIRHGGEAELEQEAGARMLKKWLELVPKSGRFARVDGQLVTLHDVTGADHESSDPLDLDHLSSRHDQK